MIYIIFEKQNCGGIIGRKTLSPVSLTPVGVASVKGNERSPQRVLH